MLCNCKAMGLILQYPPMSRSTVYIFLSIICLGFTSCSEQGANDSDEIIQDSVSANRVGTPEQQIESLSSAIREQPKLADNYHLRAKVYLEMDNGNAALRDVSSAVARDSTNAEFYYTGMRAFRSINRIPEAVQSGLKAQSLGLESADFFSDMAEVSLIRKDYENAITFANLALRQDRFNAHAYQYKGLIYLETGDTTRAVSSFQTAIEIEPTMADSYNSLITIHNDQGQHEVAMTYVQSGKRYAPYSSMILYNEGVTLQEMGFEDSSRISYALAISLDSGNYLATYNLGAVNFNAGNYEKAIPLLAKVEKTRPELPQINLLLGVAYMETSQYGLAETHLKRQLEKTPGLPMAEEALAELKKMSNENSNIN